MVFVAILVEGLNGATVDEVLTVRSDLIERIGLPEILGMLRVRGLSGILGPSQEGSHPGPPSNSPSGPDRFGIRRADQSLGPAAGVVGQPA